MTRFPTGGWLGARHISYCERVYRVSREACIITILAGDREEFRKPGESGIGNMSSYKKTPG